MLIYQVWAIFPTLDEEVNVEHFKSERSHKTDALWFWVKPWCLSCVYDCSRINVTISWTPPHVSTVVSESRFWVKLWYSLTCMIVQGPMWQSLGPPQVPTVVSELFASPNSCIRVAVRWRVWPATCVESLPDQYFLMASPVDVVAVNGGISWWKNFV